MEHIEEEKANKCDCCGHVEYEDLESCWGFYGLDYCREEAKEVADNHAEGFSHEEGMEEETRKG